MQLEKVLSKQRWMIRVIPEGIKANNHTFSLNQFHESLRAWGIRYRRIYPWRMTENPFHIMMAELMLRRTQAQQVIKIYEDFHPRNTRMLIL